MPPLGPIRLINHDIGMVMIALKCTKRTLIFEKTLFSTGFGSATLRAKNISKRLTRLVSMGLRLF